MDLSGKTAIVTGGASGVGKAIARALILEGVNVLLASRRSDLLHQVASELNELGRGRALPVPCDVRNKHDVEHVVRESNVFPSLDFVVNNTGIGVGSRIVDCSESDWDLVMDTNVKGTFFMCQAALPRMMAQRSGFILNIASQAAKHGYPQAGPYCASKFGVVGLAQALQAEVREFGIRVHSLCPGLIQVPPPGYGETPRDGVLQVEDLAATALFLFKRPTRVKFEDIGLYHL